MTGSAPYPAATDAPLPYAATPRHAAIPRPAPPPGYDLVRTLSRTPTSTILLCRHADSGRLVAAKTANASDPATFARLRRETDLLARLRGIPNILPLLGFGVTGTGSPYLLLEFATGGSYTDLMERETLPVDDALALGVCMASALHAAHRRGVVHRDVKPSNILITDRGPMLSDFGIAATIYDSGRITGLSRPWAPPEVLDGRSGGGETADCYALAATLHALMTGTARRGRYPAPAPTSPQEGNAMSREVRAVLNRAMDPDPDRRFPTALAFGRALQELQTTQATRIARTGCTGQPPASLSAPLAPASHIPADAPQSDGSPSAAPGRHTRRRRATPRSPRDVAAPLAICVCAALILAASVMSAPARETPADHLVPLGPSLSESPSYPQSEP